MIFNTIDTTLLTEKLKNLVISYFRLFGLYIFFFFCVAILKEMFPAIDLDKYSGQEIITLFKNNKLMAFLSMVLIAPVLEETMFRSVIVPTHRTLLLFLSAWTLFGIQFFIPKLALAWYFLYPIAILVFIAMYALYHYSIPKKLLYRSADFLSKHRILVLQITSILFGLMHIFNYVDTFSMDSSLFLMIVPRIIAGHVCGQLKITNKTLIWPIALHAMNNGLIFIILLMRH